MGFRKKPGVLSEIYLLVLPLKMLIFSSLSPFLPHRNEASMNVEAQRSQRSLTSSKLKPARSFVFESLPTAKFLRLRAG